MCIVQHVGRKGCTYVIFYEKQDHATETRVYSGFKVRIRISFSLRSELDI